MTACKCKRCGKLYEPYGGIRPSEKIMAANGILFIDSELSGVEKRTTVMNLCPECMAGMADWWKNTKISKEECYES